MRTLWFDARTHAKQAPVIRLIDDLKKAMDTLPVQQAKPGQVVTGSSDRLSLAPPPLPWRTWLLWASLYRQLHTSTE